MADVFAFRGRAYYGKPGWEYRPAEVEEDFGAWRATKSQDGKAVADWLVKNGFRMVYRTIGKGHESRVYAEWWAKVEMVGTEGMIEPTMLRGMLALKLHPPREDDPPSANWEDHFRDEHGVVRLDWISDAMA